MNKIIILGILVMLLFSSCTNIVREDRIKLQNNFRVYPICEDRVVCYREYTKFSIACITDEYVVNKYCGTITTAMVEIK